MDKEISRLNEVMNREQELPEDKMERAMDQHELELERKAMIEYENRQIAKQEFNPEDDLAKAQRAAKALMQVVKQTKPLKLGGKEYLYFEHWQTIAKFFNTSVGIERVTKIEKGWEAKSVVYQNGIIIGGAIASCSTDEPNWKNKPEFQLKSMAQTRSMAKALRSIFGYVAVLANYQATPAEEINEEIINNPKSKVYIDIEEDDINEIVPGNFPPPVKYSGITSMGKMNFASPKQIGFIKSLRKQKNLPEIPDDQFNQMTSAQASDIIKELNVK